MSWDGLISGEVILHLISVCGTVNKDVKLEIRKTVVSNN